MLHQISNRWLTVILSGFIALGCSNGVSGAANAQALDALHDEQLLQTQAHLGQTLIQQGNAGNAREVLNP